MWTEFFTFPTGTALRGTQGSLGPVSAQAHLGNSHLYPFWKVKVQRRIRAWPGEGADQHLQGPHPVLSAHPVRFEFLHVPLSVGRGVSEKLMSHCEEDAQSIYHFATNKMMYEAAVYKKCCVTSRGPCDVDGGFRDHSWGFLPGPVSQTENRCLSPRTVLPELPASVSSPSSSLVLLSPCLTISQPSSHSPQCRHLGMGSCVTSSLPSAFP